MTREELIEIFNGDTIPLAVLHEGLKINNEKYAARFNNSEEFSEFYYKLPEVAQNMLIRLSFSNLQKRHQINELLDKDLQTIKFI